MKTLKDLLLGDATRPTVVADCAHLIDEEVSSKGGLSGMVIKTSYKLVKAVKPGIIPESVDALLDDFIASLEPQYGQWQNQGAPGGIESFVTTNASSLAEAMLGITDARAARSKHKVLKSAYEKLRPEGKRQVEAAMPRIGRMLSKHGA